jgi:hypothetical protein
MHAQNLKTPAELGIPDKAFDALLKVLGMLERGEIAEHKWLNGDLPQSREPKFFNMNVIIGQSDCGTTACILGWARWVAQDFELLGGDRPRELDNLFRMGECYEFGVPSAIQPAQAAIALRNYLTFGEARWNESCTN